MSEPSPPTEIYWVTGGGSPGLYGSKQAVKLTISTRRSASGYSHVKVWHLNPPGWFDVTRLFIDEEGSRIWRK